MVEPYFENDLIRLYHGSCTDREILEVWLTEGEVLITDPPYGTNLGQDGKNTKGGYGRRNLHGDPNGQDGFTIQGDDDTGIRDEVLLLWGPHPALVFGSPRLPDPPLVLPIGDRLVWNKKRPGLNGGPWRYSHESIYVTAGWKRINDAAVSILTAYPDQRDHMHAKPVPLMMSLIEGAPEGMIVDPFAGSGSTLVAASLLGRKAIGVEIEEKYCEMLARRLGQQGFDLESLMDLE